MATERVAEWIWSGDVMADPASAYSFGFDIGQGTLLRLVYRLFYGSASAPPSGFDSIGFRVVWALQPDEPNPLHAGVEPESVLIRDVVVDYPASRATAVRSPAPDMSQDVEVPRVIGPTDRLWIALQADRGTPLFWWAYNFRALVLRP